MFLFASGSGAVVVADNTAFVSFDLEGLGGTLDAIVLQATFEPKPVIQLHGSVGGETYLNIFGEDASIIRIRGAVVGENCDAANKASSAVANTVAYFKSHSVLGRAQPLSYSLGSSSRKRGYLVAATVVLDGQMRDLANFDFVLLSEPLVEVPEIADLPDTPAAPESPGSGGESPAPASSGLSVSSQLQQGSRAFALANAQLLLPNGELGSRQVVPIL